MSRRLSRAEVGQEGPPSTRAILVVRWKERSVAVVRRHNYADQVAAIRRVREFRALSKRTFSLTASLPGYGSDPHRISEDAWPEVVHSLRTIILTEDSTTEASSPGRLIHPSNSFSSFDVIPSLEKKVYVKLKNYQRQPEETITIKIASFRQTTVADLKGLALAKGGIKDCIPPTAADQTYFFAGQFLENSRSLHDSHIRDGSTMSWLIRLRGEKHLIFVKSLDGRTLCLEITSESFLTTTIADLKELMRAKDSAEGRTPAADIKLIFAGKQLENDKTLLDYSIQAESTLHWVKRLRGDKPVIYLFPPSPLVDASVVLRLTSSWSFSAIYPTAKDISTEGGLQTIEWTVDAQPDGVLVDKANGLELSYLFWEARTNLAPPLSPPTSRPSTPFANEAARFDPARPKLTPHGSVLLNVEKLPLYLDHVLKVLSLHTEARNSFITYWLPSFLKHKYIALRFLPQASYESAAPMTVTPTPDVVTRVFMLFMGVDGHDLEVWGEAEARAAHNVEFWKKVVGVDVERAEDRSLFRVLEWGGMEVM